MNAVVEFASCGRPAAAGPPQASRTPRGGEHGPHGGADLLFDHLDFLPFVNPKEEVFYLSISPVCLQLGS